jgi:hypothetical protein
MGYPISGKPQEMYIDVACQPLKKEKHPNQRFLLVSGVVKNIIQLWMEYSTGTCDHKRVTISSDDSWDDSWLYTGWLTGMPQ